MIKQQERFWKINNDNVDQISILRDEISLKEAKILETEDLINTAYCEVEEEKKARNAADEEVRRLKKEHDKIKKKYLSLKQLSSNKDLELKKKDIEIGKFSKSQNSKETPEENRTPKKAVRRTTDPNPPQCGPPQCGLPKNKEENPPQCGPPQCGIQENENESDTGSEGNIPSGYGLNTGFTPVGTPTREQKSQGRSKPSLDGNSEHKEDSYYSLENSSASEAESSKREKSSKYQRSQKLHSLTRVGKKKTLKTETDK